MTAPLTPFRIQKFLGGLRFGRECIAHGPHHGGKPGYEDSGTGTSHYRVLQPSCRSSVQAGIEG